jgi:hypothetical protein
MRPGVMRPGSGLIPRGTAAVLSVLLLVLLPASCRSSEGAYTAESLGLSARASVDRAASSQGKVSVRFVNDGVQDVSAQRLQIRSPLFAVLPPINRETRLEAGGGSTLLFLEYGEPLCEAAGDASDAVIVLGVRTPEGTRDVAVPLADGEPGMTRAHRLACAAKAVTAQADLRLGPPWHIVDTDGTPVLRSVLEVRRKGDARLQVTQLLGNVLFTVRTPTTQPVAVLAPQQSHAQVPVQITPARCDPHALAESKMRFTFSLFVRLGDAEEVFTPLTVDGPARQALLRLLDDVCISPLRNPNPGGTPAGTP